MIGMGRIDKYRVKDLIIEKNKHSACAECFYKKILRYNKSIKFAKKLQMQHPVKYAEIINKAIYMVY